MSDNPNDINPFAKVVSSIANRAGEPPIAPRKKKPVFEEEKKLKPKVKDETEQPKFPLGVSPVVNPDVRQEPMPVVEPETRTSIDQMADIEPLLDDVKTANKLIYADMPQREVFAAFCELRDRLILKVGNNNFIILVSSACEHGGGSFVAINLAIALAELPDKTALFIDCGFDRSFSSSLLQGGAEYGLLDYLSNSALGVEDIVYASGIAKLRVTPPGGGDAGLTVDSLQSSRLKSLFSDLKGKYKDRNIVIDAPSVADALVVAPLVQVADWTMLVVPQGRLEGDGVDTAISVIGREKLAGVVFDDY